MLDYLIITGDNCPYCDKAKAALTGAGLTYAEVNLMDVPELSPVMTLIGHRTLPLVFKIVGGSDDLADNLKGEA